VTALEIGLMADNLADMEVKGRRRNQHGAGHGAVA